MVRALALATQARDAGDVPVGALVTDAAGSVIGEGRNLREVSHDPTAHAEVVAMRQAAASLGSWNLEGCTLVVTLEPCLMCAGALLQAHVSRLVFGAWDEKAGAVGSLYDVVRDRRLPSRAEVVAGRARRRGVGSAARLLRVTPLASRPADQRGSCGSTSSPR